MQALSALAHRCNYELSEFDLELYGEEAKKLGWENAVAAVTSIYRDTAQHGRFPSFNDLAERANPTGLSDEDMAKEAAALILNAVRTCGYNQPEKAKLRVGGLGWRVVETLGGWEAVTNIPHDSAIPVLSAQWRELALSLLRKHKLGITGKPELPGTEVQAIEQPKHIMLIADLAREVDRKK